MNKGLEAGYTIDQTIDNKEIPEIDHMQYNHPIEDYEEKFDYKMTSNKENNGVNIIDQVLEGLATPTTNKNKHMLHMLKTEGLNRSEQGGLRIAKIQKMLHESSKTSYKGLRELEASADEQYLPELYSSQVEFEDSGQLLGKRQMIADSSEADLEYSIPNSYFAESSSRRMNIQKNVHKYMTPYGKKVIPESLITSAYTRRDFGGYPSDVLVEHDGSSRMLKPYRRPHQSGSVRQHGSGVHQRGSSVRRMREQMRQQEDKDVVVSQRMPSRPPIIREGDWLCPHCHNINWAKRTTCNL